MTTETTRQATTDDSADEQKPLLSPTDTESAHWDAAFPDEEPDDQEGASDDESEAGEDDGVEAGAESEGEGEGAGEPPPTGTQPTGGRDYYQWTRDVMFDPTSIRNVPRGARKQVLASAEANKRIVSEAVNAVLQQQGPALQQQATAVQRGVDELNELIETDPVTFRRALHEVPPEVRAEWFRQDEAALGQIDSQADQRARAGAGRRPDVAQQRPQPSAEMQTAGEVQSAVRLELGRVATALGNESAQQVAEWIQTEGLSATREDYDKLLAHTASIGSGGRKQAIIDKRKRAPRAEVSPGINEGGRGSRLPRIDASEVSESELYADWDKG